MNDSHGDEPTCSNRGQRPAPSSQQTAPQLHDRRVRANHRPESATLRPLRATSSTAAVRGLRLMRHHIIRPNLLLEAMASDKHNRTSRWQAPSLEQMTSRTRRCQSYGALRASGR